MLIRLLTVITLTLALLAPLAPLANAIEQKPEVLGVLFYADWCGSCKVLDPIIKKARGKADLDNDAILFVRLDLTDATQRHQSALMAHTLGLSDFYNKNGGATGFMLLVNAETKEVITRLTKNMNATEITKQVRNAIALARE